MAIDVEIQVELEELEEMATAEGGSGTDKRPAHGLLSNFDPFDTLAGQESDSDSESEEGEHGGVGDVTSFSDVSSEDEGEEEEDGHNGLGDGGGALSAKEVAKRAKRVREMVAKLDGVMNVVLKWLSHTSPGFDSPGPEIVVDAPQQHPHFMPLLSIFDRTILTTFKSRYTQFLLFYLVSLPSFPSRNAAIPPSSAAHDDDTAAPDHAGPSAESRFANPHADYFLGLLLHNTLVPQQPVPLSVLTRIASASYLASFVSRAICVGKADCRQAVTLCCQWIEGRLVELEGLLLGSAAAAAQSGEGDAPAELNVFYAVVQAVFLIFCFRWRDLVEVVEDPEEAEEGEQEEVKKKWLSELGVLQRLIVSPLNPLKVR